MGCPVPAPLPWPLALAPSYEMHQLDRVPGCDAHLGERGAAHDPAVMLHHHAPRVECQRAQQLEERRPFGYRPRLAVHGYADCLIHAPRSCTMRRAVSAGSMASHSARIAATP